MNFQTIYYDSVESTNIVAGDLAKEGAPHGTLIVADKQTGGKGRRGRGWDSPEGVNIFMTLIVRPSFQPDRASMLTLLMALCVSQAIEKQADTQALIKWPNDIVVNHKKVVGILTELSMDRDRIGYVICGVGINVNQKEFPEEIKDKATSLLIETGQNLDRDSLILEVLSRFKENYGIFCEKADMSGLLLEYNKRLINKEKSVRVLDPKGEFEGVALGINKEGELLVKKPDGQTETVFAGEVSVRGLYGYV